MSGFIPTFRSFIETCLDDIRMLKAYLSLLVNVITGHPQNQIAIFPTFYEDEKFIEILIEEGNSELYFYSLVLINNCICN